jgi:hypothetical protein
VGTPAGALTRLEIAWSSCGQGARTVAPADDGDDVVSVTRGVPKITGLKPNLGRLTPARSRQTPCTKQQTWVSAARLQSRLTHLYFQLRKPGQPTRSPSCSGAALRHYGQAKRWNARFLGASWFALRWRWGAVAQTNRSLGRLFETCAGVITAGWGEGESFRSCRRSATFERPPLTLCGCARRHLLHPRPWPFRCGRTVHRGNDGSTPLYQI